MPRPVRLIIAESGGAMSALALGILGEAWPRMESQTADGPEAFARALEAPRCDLALVDRGIPWCDALEAGRILRERYPDCALLMLAKDERPQAVVQAMRAGFDDYLPESAAGSARLLAAAVALVESAHARRRDAWTGSRLSDLLSRLNVGAYRATTGGIMLYANTAFCRIFGIDSWRDAPAWSLRSLMADPSEESRLARELDRNGMLQSVELKLKRPGGREQWISLTQILRQAGDPVGVIEGLVEDITDRKARTLEGRRREEEDFQQRRLDMVGRLAGGIAHDFNNLLTAINGFSDLVLGQMPDDDPLRPNVVEIRSAGTRAALLTRQLLAFSCRLMLHPRRLDLGAFLGCLERTVADTIGPDIQLRLVHDPEIPPVHADPSQLESVIMGLAVNAKEAMEGGGTLTLRTWRHRVKEDGEIRADSGTLREQLPPGDYAVLSVEDTGKGMDRETLGRIFEPYFTTKPGLPGKVRSGNGLGLSVAYGVLKQSGGTIHVESEPGKGTRIRLYLPVVTGLAGAAVPRGHAGESSSESRA